tara:strand:- start:171 stop:395 length:225 start_codon:yes stop_codon:yes gene_type:complete
MKYGQQVQGALERLDYSLKKLHTMVKRGENANAIEFMERGELKERYDELQNIITVAGGPGNLGASGTVNTGMFK